MRIFNRKHIPWFLFVCLATLVAGALYIANFYPEQVPDGRRLPPFFGETPPLHQTVGGTPLGLIFGSVSFAIFIFAALLGLRKKIPLWRIGRVERWLRAHIWLTLLTIPLVFLHSGFHLGGPMTTLLVILYAIVMVSGIYGLALQHQVPRLMKDRLPAETVFEQIPFILEQLAAAAMKLRDSYLPPPAGKTDAGAPAPSAAKAVTTGTAPMVSTAPVSSTPSARAKTVVGSSVIAATVSNPAGAVDELTETKPARAASVPEETNEAEPDATPPKAATVPQANVPEAAGTPTARIAAPDPVGEGAEASAGKVTPPVSPEANPVPAAPASTPTATEANAAKVIEPTRPKPATVPAPNPAAKAAPAKAKAPAPEPSPESEALLVELIEQQILPFLQAKRADRHPLANARFSEDTFRFVKLRVAAAYRPRVEEIQGWCDERRMLARQARMHHWLHGWLFVHVPLSFLLIFLTAWHAFVTLFRY